jgi:hypothetical protein
LPPPNTIEKELWDKAFNDWWWLERYGLDPDRVEALPLVTRDRVPYIATLADELAEERSKRG